jgi:thiazole synthase
LKKWEVKVMTEDKLFIGGVEVKNRLFIGTGKFSNNRLIPDVIKHSNSHVVTVALRRIDFESIDENMLNFIPKACILMPNTSGARNAEEAVRIARLARATGCGNWIKIEVISSNKYLLPDNFETIRATEILVKEGFIVLPYMSPDLMAAKRLRDAGAAAVMPLGSPIGTNKGLKTKELIRIMIDEIDLPIVVDAGIGKPSEAAEAMEMGAAAVLVNTAIATAGDPVMMAAAFDFAVKSGRMAFLSGTGAVQDYAEASSPLTGFLNA